MPTAAQLQQARTAYEENEPRALFYRTALELIRLAEAGLTQITMAEALSGLLMTWNASYYRFHGKFSEQHFQDIEALLGRRQAQAVAYRPRRLEDLDDQEQEAIEDLFGDFAAVLGVTGAAKTLHLLAPRFFPLWDSKIADAYGTGTGHRGSKENRYWRFMQKVRDECVQLGGEAQWGESLVKRIDEFNYCTHSTDPPLI
jgi:hypothetical protein